MSFEESDQGTHVVLTPQGKFNMVTAPLLKERIDDLVAAGQTHVVVDLHAVDFIDSSGQLSFEWPGYVVVALASFDGLTWVGTGPVADGFRVSCGNNVMPTTFTITASPAHYTVRASDRSVVATTMSITYKSPGKT